MVTKIVRSEVDGKEYKVSDKFYYNVETSQGVIDVLERAYTRGSRIRIFLGDVESGRDWCEEHDIIGTIGRSTGIHQIPLLISTQRSMGGGSILTHCIVKITEEHRVLYQHPDYHLGEFEIKPCSIEGYVEGVYRDGENIANFRNEGEAEKYIAFLKGERNRR